jgi:hypothetical protein
MCVARQLKAYLKFRPNIDGQLFCHLNHKKLTRFQFIKAFPVSIISPILKKNKKGK